MNVASNVRVSVVLPDAATWIKEKKTSANSPNTFRFDIEQNNEYDARTAEIHFVHQASNLRKVATVTQEPQGAIQLASSYYEVNPEGGTLNIEVQSNTAIEVQTSTQWIKQVEPRGMETMAFTFEILANAFDEDREGLIYLRGNNVEQAIKVRQLGNAQFRAKERAALIEFYKATDGDNWTDKTNWCSDKPLSTWHGIKCDIISGRVTQIDLTYNNLRGDLNKVDLSDLSGLVSFNVNANYLSGPIPTAFLVKLKGLRELNLSSNKFTGTIPPELGQLSNLSGLDLGWNELTGAIPPELGQLSNLTVLSLTNNQLTGPLPKELCQLSNLYKLALGLNQLSGEIPKEIGQLKELRRLLLQHNELTGSIPTEIGQLSELRELLLRANKLTGPIPAELCNLPYLVRLWLEMNKLSGSLPEGLGNLPYLEDLAIYENNLTGSVPASYSKLSNWRQQWVDVVVQNTCLLSIDEVTIPGPIFEAKTIDGGWIDSRIYAENEYTILFNFADWCANSHAFAPELLKLYNGYKNKGVGVVCYTLDESISDEGVAAFRDQYQLPWPCFSIKANAESAAELYVTGKITAYAVWPTISVIDRNGKLVFNHIYDVYGHVGEFLQEKLGPPDETN